MYLLQFVPVSLDCNIYFIFEKQAFNGLLKVIGNSNAYFETNLQSNDFWPSILKMWKRYGFKTSSNILYQALGIKNNQEIVK